MSRSQRSSSFAANLPFWITGILIPILGLLFLNWGALEVVYMYWFETWIIGLYNVPKMLAARGKSIVLFGKDLTEDIAQRYPAEGDTPEWFGLRIKITLTLFFLVHYGMFCALQGVFIFGTLSDSLPSVKAAADQGFFGPFWNAPLAAAAEKGLWLSLVLMLANHGLQTVFHFFVGKDYERQHAVTLMVEPYKRVFVQQFIIILGGFFLILSGAPIFAAILLIVLRSVVDWYISSGRLKWNLPEMPAK